MKGLALIVLGTLLCAMIVMAAPAADGSKKLTLEEQGRCMIDAFTDAVANTGAKEHWTARKPICERALAELVYCTNSADPSLCFMEKVLALNEVLYKSLDSNKISLEMASKIQAKMNECK